MLDIKSMQDLLANHDARYCNDPNFSDRLVRANSEDPDQTAPEEQSGQGLHCLLFDLHLYDEIP